MSTNRLTARCHLLTVVSALFLSAPVHARSSASQQHSTASEATGCHTQQSDRENHSGKLSVASGRFARGTLLVASHFLCKASVVIGTVSYQQHIGLLRQAVVQVQLLDVSK